MAKGESIDPLEFSKEDRRMGGVEPIDKNGLMRVVDQNGTERWKTRGRLVAGLRDRITMAQMKSSIAALWADGQTYGDIAENVSDYYGLEGSERISSHGIKYHVQSMLEYWRQKGLALMDERQAVILTRFDQIEALAVEAYFASMEGKRTKTKTKQIERAKSKDRQKTMQAAEREKRAEFRVSVNGVGRPGTGRTLGQDLFIDTGELADMKESLLDVGEKISKNTRFEENRAGDPKFLNIITNINIQRAKILGLYNKGDNADGNSEAAKLSDEQRHARMATILSAARERRVKTANMLADPAPLGGFAENEAPTNGNGKVEIPKTNTPELVWDFDEDGLDLPITTEIEWD